MDMTLQTVLRWCIEHHVDPSTVTLHPDGSVTLQAVGYPTQYAYSLLAAMKGLEQRIAEAQVAVESAEK